MGGKPRHARVRARSTVRRWVTMVVTTLLVGMLGFAAPASATPPQVENFDYGVNCTEAWLYPGRALTNGDHINIDVVINGVKQQRNAYVDQNVAGGYNGLGIRVNGFDPIPLTEAQVKTGSFRFAYSNYITEDSYTVEWVQFNSVYFNKDRDPAKFLECDGTPPPPEQCVPEYEWVKKSKEYQYEHRVEVLKEQARFKAQERVRTWKPGKDEVKEYRTQTRAWLQPSEHKQVRTTWRFGGSGATRINGVTVSGTWSNAGGSASWYELPSAVTNAVWGPSGPPSSIVPPSSSESRPATGSVSLSTYGAPSSAGTVQYKAWLVPEGEWSGWSNWSSWSATNPGPSTDTMRVESRVSQEATPGSWLPYGSWSWAGQVTDWMDLPVTEIADSDGTWEIGVPGFVGNDEAKQRQYIQFGDTRQVNAGWDVAGPELYKKGEQPAGWTLVQPEQSREVVVDGPVWSSEKPGKGWVKTGKERKVNCLVTPPDFNPGTCLVPGTTTAPDTDVYSWNVTGPTSAKVYTAVSKGDNVLAGQTVFGPYDLTQVNWKSDECLPAFEVDQTCGYVQVTYINNSKWDRWPDYSFTGDTTESTDYGSGPVWNTVKVVPGESRVIFERYFDEDYAEGGPIEVWFQDILGAERDIDTARVTLAVETDCDPNELNPVLPETTPQVCTPPNGDLTGGSIVLPDGTGSLEYKVYQGGVEVNDLDNLSPGDYQVVAMVTEEHRVIPGGNAWIPAEDGQSATATVTIDAADDCYVERPPTPPVEYGDWEGVPVCGDTELTQTRWVREYADAVWDGVNKVWAEDEVGTLTEETRVRELTPKELEQLEEDCTELPPPPEDDPKSEVSAASVKFVDPTRVCSADGVWEWKDGIGYGQVIIPSADGVVYLDEDGEIIRSGSYKVRSSQAITVTAKVVDDEDSVLVGDSEWSHEFKLPEVGGDCGELATTGMSDGVVWATGLAATALLLGSALVVAARSRKRDDEMATTIS